MLRLVSSRRFRLIPATVELAIELSDCGECPVCLLRVQPCECHLQRRVSSSRQFFNDLQQIVFRDDSD